MLLDMRIVEINTVNRGSLVLSCLALPTLQELKGMKFWYVIPVVVRIP